MLDYDRLMDLLAALAKENVEYILVGATAINLLGLARVTRDVDLFVSPDPENVKRLRSALRAVWDDPNIEEIRAEDLAGEFPTIRYGPPDESFIVDVIARLGDAFTYPDLEFEAKVIDGVPVRLATPYTLYRMKKDTLRLQDKADAERLRRKFGFEV